MNQSATVVAVWMTCLAAAASAYAGETARTKRAGLSCGRAYLTATTTLDAHVPPDDGFAWLDQTITLQAQAGAQPIRLAIDPAPSIRLPDGRQALADLVISWACVQGSRPVVMLEMTCARDDLGGVCHGEKEWFRLLETSGHRLDEGYQPQDPRYPALYARLGMTDETAMRDATGD